MPRKFYIGVALLFGLGAILLALAQVIRGIPGPTRRSLWIKYCVYLLLIFGLLLSAEAGRILCGAILAALSVGGAVEVARVSAASGRLAPSGRHPAGMCGNARGGRWRRLIRAVLCALILGAALGHMLLGRGEQWRIGFAASVLLVAVTDSFSQVWGMLLGRHRLCPRLSPGKTVEGLAGGLLSAVAASLLFGFLIRGLAAPAAALLGFLTAVGSVCGDLLFSGFKRRYRVKDFSSLLPGHGGLLDRFDSLVVGAPVYFWARALLEAGIVR